MNITTETLWRLNLHLVWKYRLEIMWYSEQIQNHNYINAFVSHILYEHLLSACLPLSYKSIKMVLWTFLMLMVIFLFGFILYESLQYILPSIWGLVITCTIFETFFYKPLNEFLLLVINLHSFFCASLVRYYVRFVQNASFYFNSMSFFSIVYSKLYLPDNQETNKC